jgi:hypothetical protein
MLQGAGTRMCRHYAIATNSSRAPRVDRVERDEFGRCDAQRPTATLNRSSRYGHPQRRRPQPWTRCIKARRRAWTCPCVRTKEGSLRRPRTPVRAAATTKLSPQSDVLLGIAFSPVRAISKRHPRESTQRVRNTCTGIARPDVSQACPKPGLDPSGSRPETHRIPCSARDSGL